ncbi:MAG: amidophosphoribosyltransferase [Anaerolineae bacterium]|nr:amidophosphoribosyltransferase [Anaerolineae bacterium]
MISPYRKVSAVVMSPDNYSLELDRPRESCGVFGVFLPGANVARTAFYGLSALQHRGQESAGIAVSDGQSVRVHKAMGLVMQVFTEEALRPLEGHIGIGHNRYSTKGSSRLVNAQPFVLESFLGPLAVAHNGNLVNTGALRRQLLEKGVGLTTSCDSEVITQMIAGGNGDNWTDRLRSFMARAEGAYSLTVLTRNALYGVRDPQGFRPLCLGRLGEGWVIASESCALTTVGAEFVREIEPGEIVRVDRNGVTSIRGREPGQPSLCIFEFIYFARPDSVLDGRWLHTVRRQLGAALAQEHPVDADMVIGVPDSATAAAIGYAHESGLPFNEGLTKNRYIGRTFIQPDDQQRAVGVTLKLNPLPDNLRGQRVVVVDDSIVRGTTTGRIVDLLRDAGAKEIHVRISSPPLRHPCFMGVDMATYQELIAHRMSVEEIRRHIHADSLAFLSLEAMIAATGRADGPFCSACFTGCYPVEVEAAQDKQSFEALR